MSEDANTPHDPLSNSFDIESAIVPANTPLSVYESLIQDPNEEIARFREHVDADFAYARDNIINTIEKAQRALDKAIDLANASQQPRSYEVVHNFVKVVVDSNHSLLDLSKKSKELKALELIAPESGPSNVTNNLFVGSMDELQKTLKGIGIETNVKTIITDKDKTIEGKTIDE